MATKSVKNSNAARVCDLYPVRPPKPYGVINRYNEFLNLVGNSIAIDGVKDDNYRVVKFIKSTLLTKGVIGYDGITSDWYDISPKGQLDIHGDYKSATFLTRNGNSFTRTLSYIPKEGGAFLIDALPVGGITFADLIKEACDFMEQADLCARQNLEAIKTPFIAVVKDEALRYSIEQAVEQKQLGQACLVVSSELGDAVKGVNLQTPFIADKALELRDKERDTLLNKLGVLTANHDKKERVQSAEVNAKLGECTDYIYMLIDTFNAQCSSYGLPFSMHYNGSMEELYEDAGDENPAPVSEQEEKQVEGAKE